MTDILGKSLNLISGISKATKTAGKRNRTLETIPSALNLFFTKLHNDAVSSRKPLCENPAIAQFLDQYLDSLKRRWTVTDTRDEVIANASEHAVRLRFIAQLNLVGTERFNIAEFCAENLAFQPRFDEYALQTLLCQTSRSPDHFILFTNILRKQLSPSENNTSHLVALGFALNSPLFDVDETHEVLATLLINVFSRSRSVLVRSKCLLCAAKAIRSRKRPTRLSQSNESANENSGVALSEISNMVKTSLVNSDSSVEFNASCALVLDACRILDVDDQSHFLSQVKFQLLVRVRKLRIETLLERENVMLAVRVVRTFGLILQRNSTSPVDEESRKDNEGIVDWFVRLMNALASATKRHQHAVLYELLRTVIRCAPLCYFNVTQAENGAESPTSTASNGFDWLLQRAVFCVEKLLHSQTEPALIFMALNCMNELLKACDDNLQNEAETNQSSARRSFCKSVRSLVFKHQSVLSAQVARFPSRDSAGFVNLDEKEARIALEILVRVTNRQNLRAVLRLFETRRVDLQYFATLFVSLLATRTLLAQFDMSSDRFQLFERVLLVFRDAVNLEDVQKVANVAVAQSASDAIAQVRMHFTKQPQHNESVLTFFYMESLRCALSESAEQVVREACQLQSVLLQYFVQCLDDSQLTDLEANFRNASLKSLVDVVLCLATCDDQPSVSSQFVALHSRISDCELKRQLAELANARKWIQLSRNDSESESVQPLLSEVFATPIDQLDFSLSFLDAIVVQHLESSEVHLPRLSDAIRSKVQASHALQASQPTPVDTTDRTPSLLDGVAQTSPSEPVKTKLSEAASGAALLIDLDQKELKSAVSPPSGHREINNSAIATAAGSVDSDVRLSTVAKELPQSESTPAQRKNPRPKERSLMDDLFLGVDGFE